MTTSRMFGPRLVALAITVAGSALSLGAQTPSRTPAQPAAARLADARWTPWVGCWTPGADSLTISLSGTGTPSYVCVTPAGQGVEIASIVNGRVIARERVEATGSKIDKTIDGCTGWESATWSEDAHRVFTRSEFTCPGNVKRRESGVFAMATMDEWLDIQGVDVMGATSARATRFREALVEVAPAGGDSVVVTPVDTPERYAMRTARMAAASPIIPEDVVDAVKNVDMPVAEAWLTEVHQPFTLNAKMLMRLSDAGMPTRIIDLMIALSNPKAFVVARAGGTNIDRAPRVAVNGRTDTFGNSAASRFYGSAYDCSRFGGRFDVYGLGYSDRCYGSSVYGGRYGYSPYGNGYYNGYGYNSYYGSQPIIIVTRPDPTSRPATSGRAIAGKGYTRDPYTPDRGSSSSMGSMGSSSSGATRSQPSSGSAGGSSAGSSSGGDTGGRTAKARGSN